MQRVPADNRAGEAARTCGAGEGERTPADGACGAGEA